MVLSKASPTADDGFGGREEELAWLRHELVADGVAGEAVVDGFVDDLEAAVGGGVGVCEAGCLEGRLGDTPGVAVGVVLFGLWDGDGVFLDDCVLRAVDHGVDSHAEQMLVVWGKYTR